jgi:hypothetical protein
MTATGVFLLLIVAVSSVEDGGIGIPPIRALRPDRRSARYERRHSHARTLSTGALLYNLLCYYSPDEKTQEHTS